MNYGDTSTQSAKLVKSFHVIPAIQEAEAGGSLSPGVHQPGQHREKQLQHLLLSLLLGLFR